MTLLISFIILISLFIIGWIIAGKIHNVAIVDAMWALSLGVPVFLYIRVFEGQTTRDFLLILMAMTWSLRLGSHLIQRIAKEHPTEDKRYAGLRKKWGEHASRNFLIIFLINALLVFFLSLPFYFSAKSTAPIHWLEWLGIFTFFIGLAGESLSDYQLKQFKQNKNQPNSTKICRVGLWNYSRHPNYFFEAIIWFGIYLFCAASPGGIYTIHAPIIITFLLIKVSGIPPLEKYLLESKGDAYRKYQQSTSAFIPWFKK